MVVVVVVVVGTVLIVLPFIIASVILKVPVMFWGGLMVHINSILLLWW